MNRTLDVASSFLATLSRVPAGMTVGELGSRPEQPLELYEFEGCPHCRLVREVLTELDLDAQIYPCPKGGERYRAKVLRDGGKTQFPYLVDPNTGTALYESADIIRMFNSAFDGIGATEGDYYPEPLRGEIDEINARVYSTVNNGVYKAGFATTQGAYEEAVEPLFESLE